MSALGHQPLSPLDGRYQAAMGDLPEYFSEQRSIVNAFTSRLSG